jgi:hypothetical protein
MFIKKLSEMRILVGSPFIQNNHGFIFQLSDQVGQSFTLTGGKVNGTEGVVFYVNFFRDFKLLQEFIYFGRGFPNPGG